MFKYFREMRELKKAKLQGEVIILNTICKAIDGMPDIITLAKKVKDMDMVEVQKEIVSVLVDYMKVNETKPTETDGK